ncbi:hypothetical protein BEP19_03915 [Ammoniphilus oxalaticus]|uniref:Uncharacterized protein n=1 Tax=Ammoniphilus oxalaticus TaxID=66863 RepID=A0A419SLQ4_9BACL|nr:Ger(x)C family spore germination protein [Ammoniphilus oxalaticus]RKD24991.1 hypothetical protein BEP19_03915 [Ammoniphilus oxalaticus]
MRLGLCRLPICLFVCSLLLTGCWDRVEVNDIAVVVATGVDLEEDGLYRISVQLPLVTGNGGESSFYVDSERGRTIREAIGKMQRRMARQLIFSHRRILVVGEDVAKDGIYEFFDELARLPDNRLTVRMVIAEGKAMDMLQANPNFEPFSSEAMREITKLPFVIPINLQDIAHALNIGADPITPYLGRVETEPDSGNQEVEFIGYAQFKKDRMVDVFKNEAANGAHWFAVNFMPYTITFDIKEAGKSEAITVKIYEAHRRIRSRMNDRGEMEIQLKVNLRGAVQESHLTADLRFPSNREKLDEKFLSEVREQIEAFIDQAKRQKTDSGEWGFLINQRYPKEWQDRYAQDWHTKLEELKFDIQIKGEIDRLGQISENIAKER